MKRKSMDEEELEFETKLKKVKTKVDHRKIIKCLVSTDDVGIKNLNFENYIDAIELIQCEYKLHGRVKISYKY